MEYPQVKLSAGITFSIKFSICGLMEVGGGGWGVLGSSGTRITSQLIEQFILTVDKHTCGAESGTIQKWLAIQLQNTIISKV